ncbi:hypothetical protein T484DRAFT_1874361 [Baffinella frigidus]|nr:hypothetical protein T484DRAFT_1874361 [Cryptophyta sp. CCMP2293]
MGGMAGMAGMAGEQGEAFWNMFSGNDQLMQALQESMNFMPQGVPPPSVEALETVMHLQIQDGEVVECPVCIEKLETGAWGFEIPTVCEHYNHEKSLSVEGARASAEASSCSPHDLVAKRLALAREHAASRMLDESWHAVALSHPADAGSSRAGGAGGAGAAGGGEQGREEEAGFDDAMEGALLAVQSELRLRADSEAAVREDKYTFTGTIT